MRRFQIALWLESHWTIAQCLSPDIATQGGSRQEALINIEQALRLHFEKPAAAEQPVPHGAVPAAAEEMELDVEL